MKRLIILLISLLSFSSFALVKPELALFLKQDLSKGLVSDASLIIFDNGHFRFKTNVGGWRFCSSPLVGRFSGELTSSQKEKIRFSLDQIMKQCLDSQGCSRQFKETPGAALYTLEVHTKKFERIYLSAEGFSKWFSFLDETSFFKSMKPEFGVGLNFSNDRLELQALGDKDLVAHSLGAILSYDEKGMRKEMELKEPLSLIKRKGTSLSLKNKLELKRSYRLSLEVSDPLWGKEVFHLCRFN